MTTNATVDDRHTKEAERIATLGCDAGVATIAQALANLEAARAENADLTNRLAEMRYGLTQIASKSDGSKTMATDEDEARYWRAYALSCRAIARLTLASGHTPSPCPGCAAKEEAMAELRADMSGAILQFSRDNEGLSPSESALFSRFIIPPADPLAEALVAKFRALPLDGDAGCDKLTDGEWHKVAKAALAELKSRLPLGGAK